MISFILGGLCIATFSYICYNFAFERPPNFPPGPPKVPYFGSYIFMLLLNHKHLHFAVDRICEFYKTTMLGLYLSNFPTIIINDLETMKKALNQRDFDGRPDIELTRLRHPTFEPNHGIFFHDGESWREQRRFTLRYLRDFGFGRRFDSLETEIEIQIRQFIDIIKHGPKFEHEQKYVKRGRVLMPYAFGPFVGNCHITCLLNEPIARENMADIYRAVDSAYQFQRGADDYGRLFSIIPEFGKVFPNWSGYNACRSSSLVLYDVFKKIIDEQIRTLNPNHERSFIDMYLKKMREEAVNTVEKTNFTLEQLVLTCVDFALPSLSAIPTTLSFLFMQMCLEPEVQRKVHEEIDRVVGRGRPPTLNDRINLPYTEACIREIMRFETLVPSGVSHRALVDTEFMGYTVPKDTLIIMALNSCMHDPRAFDSPEKFYPERFLESNGKLSLKKDVSLPFGAGKRLCAGETFARNMLFLCTTSFMQAFSVRMADRARPLRFDENITGTIRMPIDHWLEVTAR